jgi:hypothetical protein
MRKITIPILGLFACFLVNCGSNSSSKQDGPQNNDYLVSMYGIDSLKLGMSKSELEKLTGSPVKLVRIPAQNGIDTISIKYRGADMTIMLDGSSDSTAAVIAIQTMHPSCRTANGIAVGSDKMKVIDAYEDFNKYVAPEYEIYPKRSATKSVVAVTDTIESRAMVFHIINKKVASIEVCSYYEFY